MRPRVALATGADFPDLYDDDRDLLLPALTALGVDAAPVVWDAPADWGSYDLVVVRSTWDYTARLPDYLEWAASVPRLANPFEVLSWNTDKRYLRELASAGVPVVPTEFVEPGEAFTAPPGEHVVKPVVSAGARDTVRFAPGEDSNGHAAALLGAGRAVMVQPYQAAVDTAGETAVISFGGTFSHAARKGPVLVPDLGNAWEVAISAREASVAERAVAEQALACVPGGPLLYSRVDLVPGPDGSPVVMELEVTEPSLFLHRSDGAAERFAAAIVAWCG